MSTRRVKRTWNNRRVKRTKRKNQFKQYGGAAADADDDDADDDDAAAGPEAPLTWKEYYEKTVAKYPGMKGWLVHLQKETSSNINFEDKISRLGNNIEEEDILLNNFITKFIPQSSIIREYQKSASNKRMPVTQGKTTMSGRLLLVGQRTETIYDILINIKKLYYLFKASPNLKSFKSLILSITEYLDIIGYDEHLMWTKQCPLHGSMPNTSFGCKIGIRGSVVFPQDIYVNTFYELFIKLLEIATQNTEDPSLIEQITDKTDKEIQNIMYKFLISFFYTISMTSKTIPLERYYIYNKKINEIVGFNWFFIRCYNNPDIPKKSDNYTCGRALMIIDCDDPSPNYKVYLSNTKSSSDNSVDTDWFNGDLKCS